MKNKNTHPLDVGYLVMGLIFLGIAGTWALRQADLIDLSEMDWLLPVGLIAAGAIGLLASAAKSVSRRRAARQAEEQAPYDDTVTDWSGYPGYDPASYDTTDYGPGIGTDETTGRKET